MDGVDIPLQPDVPKMPGLSIDIPYPVIGSISPFQMGEGWLACDGRPVLVSEYRELYELMKENCGKEISIKEAYNAGGKISFREVFKLPDIRYSQGVFGWIKAKEDLVYKEVKDDNCERS